MNTRIFRIPELCFAETIVSLNPNSVSSPSLNVWKLVQPNCRHLASVQFVCEPTFLHYDHKLLWQYYDCICFRINYSYKMAVPKRHPDIYVSFYLCRHARLDDIIPGCMDDCRVRHINNNKKPLTPQHYQFANVLTSGAGFLFRSTPFTRLTMELH